MAAVYVVKLLLYTTKLWGLADLINTCGKGYRISEEDGLAYSYSVFDSYDLLAKWATRVVSIPTCPSGIASWGPVVLDSSHVLLCALKE